MRLVVLPTGMPDRHAQLAPERVHVNDLGPSNQRLDLVGAGSTGEWYGFRTGQQRRGSNLLCCAPSHTLNARDDHAPTSACGAAIDRTFFRGDPRPSSKQNSRVVWVT